MADGRRQVVDFLPPGDFFGFTSRENRALTVEAVVEGTIVALYPRDRLEPLADTDPRVGRYIREVAFQALARFQTRMLILGRTTALEKVSSFLIEMAERWSDRAADAFVLPMSRHDIADYLGLSVERVSRALTDLKHRDAIVVAGAHRVRIVDRRALREDNGG